GQGAMAQGLGALTVAIQLLDKLTWPLMSIGYLMNLYQQANSGAKRLHSIRSLNEKSVGREKISRNIESIHIKNLKVNSLEGVNLLNDINLDIKKGEHIALVGSVGSGKTVLLQTLAGLWEPEQIRYEKFKIGDIDYKDLDRSTYHKYLSFIPQTPQIFSRTLGMNISPVRPFVFDKLWRALEKADLSVDVERFPEGLSTQIGEKGMNLSGGQKQRALIARSFHSESSVYLWDDSISALDPTTEQKIIRTLRNIDPDAILVLATHRLSSLKNFDRIVVLDKGMITKIGSFEDIKRDHALFASLLKDEREVQKAEAHE
ncbi:MAG TPA: ABC transporter ATP-binding protein, partial [Bacteriovoracaceae bacterium]|nr:ABC transporter ATP-binding protein [Bacteriovoracaceae bacterium]